MKRRTCLKAALAAMSATPIALAADRARGIRLDVDLTVDPSREKEMLKNFHEIFKPAAMKQPGYIDVQIFKLRTVVMGKPPGDANYRFVLTYQSEELRQKWVASDVHKKVWPTVENTLKHKNYTVLLYDYA
jgi:heme-degrading monooxygenase HmoA